MNFINFNEHIQAMPFNEYGGSEKKRTVILDDGNKYLLKFPDPIRETGREISYINNAISEYIGCQIFKLAGFEVQDTILGKFVYDRGKEKIACACKDIRNAGETLIEMEKLQLEYIDDVVPLTFNSVKNALQYMGTIDYISAYQEYCNRFIVDAFIGNTDRHNGNWGFLINQGKGTIKIAPVYDCGSSLSPLYSDKELLDKNISRSLAMSISSVIQKENGGKIQYANYLLSRENPDLDASIRRVVPKIDLRKIGEIINEIPYITEQRKEFYNWLLTERYNNMLVPVLENVLGVEKSTEYKKWNSATISTIYDKYIAVFNGKGDNGSIELTLQNGAVRCFDYIKNDKYVFFMDNKECVGLAALEKTNLNVCKFVQSARHMGVDIDKDVITISKYEQQDGR